VPATPRTLTQADLRRSVLARQLLVERSSLPLPRALERVAGLQSQYVPTMYIGLWSRLARFSRDDLTVALQQRRVVQATLMRVTIHLVSAADYWPLALAVRAGRRRWWLSSHKDALTSRDMNAAAKRVRAALDTAGQLTRRELESVAGRDAATGVGLWIDLVRVPPSGTWERRRADLFAAASDWLGPSPDLSAADALDHLVGRYLGGFGPATAHDIANWAGMSLGEIAPSLERLGLRRFRNETGESLVDLPRLRRPEPGVPLPERFLSTWEAVLLAHARRTGVLTEQDRRRVFSTRNPHSVNTFLVDGIVAGTWRYHQGRVDLESFGPLDPATRARLTDEAARLAAFHA